MTDRVIPHRHQTISASKLIETVGDSLRVIKADDRLTDAELGAYMHRGVDAAKDYRNGDAEMGFVAFLRGCERWNGRFANDVLSLIGMKLSPLSTDTVTPQTLQSRLCRLMLEVSTALEDGELSEIEIASMKRSLVEAGEAIDGYRGKAA